MLSHLIIFLNYISKILFSGISTSTPIYKIHGRSSILYLMALLSLPGESATHYLVKNTVRTFKELGVSELQCLQCFYVSHFALKSFTHKSGHSESNRKLKMMTDDHLPHTICTVVTL